MYTNAPHTPPEGGPLAGNKGGTLVGTSGDIKEFIFALYRCLIVILYTPPPSRGGSKQVKDSLL